MLPILCLGHSVLSAVKKYIAFSEPVSGLSLSGPLQCRYRSTRKYCQGTRPARPTRPTRISCLAHVAQNSQTSGDDVLSLYWKLGACGVSHAESCWVSFSGGHGTADWLGSHMAWRRYPVANLTALFYFPLRAVRPLALLQGIFRGSCYTLI